MSTSLALICTIWDSQNFFRDNSTNIWRYLHSQTPPHDFYCHLPIRNQTNLFNYYFLSVFLFSFPDPFLFRVPMFPKRFLLPDTPNAHSSQISFWAGYSVFKVHGNQSLHLSNCSVLLIQPSFQIFICYFFF